jgi:hypothetical protein
MRKINWENPHLIQVTIFSQVNSQIWLLIATSSESYLDNFLLIALDKQVSWVGTGGGPEMIECLPRKYEALSSNPSAEKKMFLSSYLYFGQSWGQDSNNKKLMYVPLEMNFQSFISLCQMGQKECRLAPMISNFSNILYCGRRSAMYFPGEKVGVHEERSKTI